MGRTDKEQQIIQGIQVLNRAYLEGKLIAADIARDVNGYARLLVNKREGKIMGIFDKNITPEQQKIAKEKERKESNERVVSTYGLPVGKKAIAKKRPPAFDILKGSDENRKIIDLFTGQPVQNPLILTSAHSGLFDYLLRKED